MANSAKYNPTDDENSLRPESQVPFEATIRPPLRPIDKFAEPKLPCLSQRYTVAVMTFLGFFVVFGTRCSLETAEDYSKNLRFKYPIKLNWNMANNIDSYSFWSFLLAQVPGGILAFKFPANKVFALGIVGCSILNLLLPLVNDYNRVFEILFCLQGFAEGITLPAAFGIWRFWAPPLERSKLATIAFSGIFAGMLMGIPICIFLSYNIHWTSTFIFFGFLGIIWFGFWYWLVFERPCDHPAITEQELMIIENSLGVSTKLRMTCVPWINMLTSLPLYAISIASFCQMWSYFFLAHYQSKFFKHKFAFMVNENGLIVVLTYLMMTIFVPLGGFLTDFLRQRRMLSTVNVRKIFVCVSFGLQGFCFLCMTNATTASQTLLLILISIGLSGFAVSGFVVNHLDIVPRFSSILMGISSAVGFSAGLICPIVTDWLTSNPMDKKIWESAFTITGCILLAGATFYGIFSSGELQSWSEPKKKEPKDMDQTVEVNLLINDTNGV